MIAEVEGHSDPLLDHPTPRSRPGRYESSLLPSTSSRGSGPSRWLFLGGFITGLLASTALPLVATACAGDPCGEDLVGALGSLDVSRQEGLPFTIDSAELVDSLLTLTWHTDDGRAGTVSWAVEPVEDE